MPASAKAAAGFPEAADFSSQSIPAVRSPASFLVSSATPRPY
jgi:hypothetical protein